MKKKTTKLVSITILIFSNIILKRAIFPGAFGNKENQNNGVTAAQFCGENQKGK